MQLELAHGSFMVAAASSGRLRGAAPGGVLLQVVPWRRVHRRLRRPAIRLRRPHHLPGAHPVPVPRLLRPRLRRLRPHQGRKRRGRQQQAPGPPRRRDHRGRQVPARDPVPRRRLLRRHRRPRRPRRRRFHRRAVVRRADGAARRQGVQPPGRRRAAGRPRRRRLAPLQVPRQRPQRQGPRPPHRGAHGGDDGVFLPAGPAVQLPAPRRRPGLRPDDPAGIPVGAQIPVRARGLEHAASLGPRQRRRVRRLHPPQHPGWVRRDRLRRRALQRHGHRRRRRLLLRPAQQLLRPLLPAGLRRRHGAHGQHRRRHRRQRRGQEGLLQVQLTCPSMDPSFIAHSSCMDSTDGHGTVGFGWEISWRCASSVRY